MKKPKQLARAICKKYKKPDISVICHLMECEGFLLLTYGENEKVDRLLDCIGLRDFAYESKAFTYCDENNKFVFIHEGQSESERLVLLSHELGHILLGHLPELGLITKSTELEREADEFCAYLLHQSRGSLFLFSPKRLIAAALILLTGLLLVLWLGGMLNGIPDKASAPTDSLPFVQQKNDFVCITKSGKKYHLLGCSSIKNSQIIQISQKEAVRLGYLPCKICKP